jgi:repressor LexA
MDDLTPRQREVLDFLCTYQTQHQMPPTRADIARHFGFASANAAEDHLQGARPQGLHRASRRHERAASSSIGPRESPDP